jgi:hypothetical protein
MRGGAECSLGKAIGVDLGTMSATHRYGDGGGPSAAPGLVPIIGMDWRELDLGAGVDYGLHSISKRRFVTLR